MAISVGDAVLRLGVDTKDFEKGMKGIGAKIKQHQKAIGIGMAAAGTVILGGLAMSLKAATNFETAMREVNTMMGLSQDEFVVFSKEVQTLASRLGVDAVDSAKALYQAISAGVPRENVLTFLEIATKAAIGGVTDTETAVDGLTTVINAFKLPMSDAQKVADIMFTTVKGGKTTFEELSASIFQVAPIAAASGVRFEEVAAALATMTKQGVPTTVATTQLRQAMVALQKPTKEMNDVINSLGYESGQTMVQELGLARTLDTLRDATGGSNEMLMKMFGSVEAGGAVLALSGDNTAMFTADLEAMENATGAATGAFEEMDKSATRQMAALKSSFSDVSITVGNVLLPILTNLLDKVKPIVETIKNWIAEHPGLTKVIVIGAAAFGVMLIVLGSLLLIMPGLTAATAAFGITLNAAIWPITLIVLAIVALIAIGVLLWKNWDRIKEKAIATWNTVKNFFVDLWESIKQIFTNAWEFIKGIFLKYHPAGLVITHWETIKGFFSGLWESVAGIFTNWWENIKTFLASINPWDMIKERWEELRDGISGILKSIFGGSIVEDWAAGLHTFLGSQDFRPEGEKMFKTLADGAKTELERARKYFERFGSQADIMRHAISEIEVGLAAMGVQFVGGQFVSLQQGGIAMRPMTARIAEKQPEAVIPLDRFEGMLGGKKVSIYVELDGRIIAEAVEVRLTDDIRLKTGVKI